MGAEAAVNAVYAAKLAQLPEDERAAETARLRAEYDADIDIVRLASELVIDDIVQPEALAGELSAAFRRRPRQAAPGGPPPPSDQPRLKSTLMRIRAFERASLVQLFYRGFTIYV